MRAIASDVEISVGNLTYYFPRKKDLVSALMALQRISGEPFLAYPACPIQVNPR